MWKTKSIFASRSPTSLRKAGYEVWTASSGAEALASFRQVRPDVILLDIMLPDLDGFEVYRVRWIREQIEDDPSSPRRLVTRRHVGYQFWG